MVAEVDLALELYGPEAAGAAPDTRGPPTFASPLLRRFGARAAAVQFRRDADDILSQNSFFDRLKPETEAQRGLLATARDQVRKLADTDAGWRANLANPVPAPATTVVICWSLGALLGNGLVAATNTVKRCWRISPARCPSGSRSFCQLNSAIPIRA